MNRFKLIFCDLLVVLQVQFEVFHDAPSFFGNIEKGYITDGECVKILLPYVIVLGIVAWQELQLADIRFVDDQ